MGHRQPVLAMVDELTFSGVFGKDIVALKFDPIAK
jgi:hypothetical protein